MFLFILSQICFLCMVGEVILFCYWFSVSYLYICVIYVSLARKIYSKGCLRVCFYWNSYSLHSARVFFCFLCCLGVLYVSLAYEIYYKGCLSVFQRVLCFPFLFNCFIFYLLWWRLVGFCLFVCLVCLISVYLVGSIMIFFYVFFRSAILMNEFLYAYELKGKLILFLVYGFGVFFFFIFVYYYWLIDNALSQNLIYNKGEVKNMPSQPLGST